MVRERCDDPLGTLGVVAKCRYFPTGMVKLVDKRERWAGKLPYLRPDNDTSSLKCRNVSTRLVNVDIWRQGVGKAGVFTTK